MAYLVSSVLKKSLHQHFFFVRLQKIYGAPDAARLVLPGGIRLLKLKLVFNNKEVLRSLPASMSVQKLYGMASRLFSLDIRKVFRLIINLFSLVLAVKIKKSFSVSSLCRKCWWINL